MTETRRRRTSTRRLAILLLAFASLAPAFGGAEDLSAWRDRELVPWLTDRFTVHPRYKGEAVRVAVFDGSAEDPTPDLLSVGVADHLERVLAGQPSVRLTRGAAEPDWDARTLPTRLPCVPPAETYVVAVESRAGPGDAVVRVRILDAREQLWVPGEVREWRGRLDGGDRRDLGRTGVRDDLRGRRDLPFLPGQEDLLAARAAHALGCALLAHPAEDLTLWTAADAGGREDPWRGRIAGLVPSYLARSGVVRTAGDRSAANMALTVETLSLDSGVEQVWIAVGPADPDPDLPSVRTSFYVNAPASVAATPSAPDHEDGPTIRAPGLTLVRDRCGHGYGPCPGDAFLELRAAGAVHAELIAVADDGALVRLFPSRCAEPAASDAGGVLRWPLEGAGAGPWLAAYAVTARTREASDALRREFESLPALCDNEHLRGAAARGRLVTLGRRLARHDGDIDWWRVELAGPGTGSRLAQAGPE